MHACTYAMQCHPKQDRWNQTPPSIHPLQKSLLCYIPLSYPIHDQKAWRSNPISSRLIPPDATVHVDVAVPEAADGEHHAVRVEGRAGDCARARGREEGGVGLDGVDGRTGDVEEGEGVRVGASVFS